MLVYLIVFLSAVFLTYTIKKIALRKNILDIPNERSSHTIPTPRGGGLAIIVVFYIWLLIFHNSIDTNTFNALLCAIPIAIIAFLDDIKPLSFKIRLLIQTVCAISSIYFLGGIDKIDFLYFKLEGWWLNIFAFFAILWLTNLYNFLDGIDGYAGMEALTVGIGSYILTNNEIALVIAFASLGFLIFNWHKASIFMGDVGSSTLGFIFAILCFSDANQHGNIWIWIILLELFWLDATITLFRRVKNREKVTVAHKKHIYQRAVQIGYTHSQVVLFASFVNIVNILLMIVKINFLAIFIFNLFLLYFIIKYIDKKKSF